MSIIGIIPARFQSSRFPGKMLAPILEKTLLQRTFESAKKCKILDKLIVACDDERIMKHVTDFGGNAYMTSNTCLNGTSRIIDAIERYPELQKGTIFVCIQGDMPCISDITIEKVVTALKENPNDVMATPIVKIEDQDDIFSPSTVKCVIDINNYALYFSRSPIPAPRVLNLATYYKQIGIYAYRKEFLLNYKNIENTTLQLHEDLEQLKIIEHGFHIKTVEVNECALSVDTIDDIQKVEQYLCNQNISLSVEA